MAGRLRPRTQVGWPSYGKAHSGSRDVVRRNQEQRLVHHAKQVGEGSQTLCRSRTGPACSYWAQVYEEAQGYLGRVREDWG